MERNAPRVLILPLVTIILTVLAAAGAALLMSTQSAYAEINGPCSAAIAGTDVAAVDSGNRDDDIEVSKSQAVPVSASSPAGFRSHKIQLEFAGRRWTVSNEQDDRSTTWSDTVNVDDYATYGVGLYKVIGVSTLMDGTKCTGAATVDVSGNPLTTIAGGVATGAAAVGTLGAAASLVRSGSPSSSGRLAPIEEAVNMMEEASEAEERRRRREEMRERFTRPDTPNAVFLGWLFDFPFWFGCWALSVIALIMVPFMAIAGGGAGESREPPRAPAATAAPQPPQRLPRAPWRPRITLLGLVGGLVAGAGFVVLFQQYSIAYPTLSLVMECVLGTIAAYGIVLPTLGSTVGWLRLNRRIAALEK